MSLWWCNQAKVRSGGGVQCRAGQGVRASYVVSRDLEGALSTFAEARRCTIK